MSTSPGSSDPRTVLVTGASSGIGEQTCRLLTSRGDKVHAAARREDRLQTLSRDCGVQAHPIDLTDEQAVSQLADELPELDAIVHCAGGARGSAGVAASVTADWEWMWQTNVLASMYLLRGLVPGMVERGRGDIIVITSVAAFECNDGSAGYSTSKHAQSAMTQTLRNELLGTGVNVTEISPGVVATEFFQQRFPDAPHRAEQIFLGLVPLTPDDIAAAVGYVLDQPRHVNIDRIVLRPTAQGSHGRFHRQ